MNTEEKVSAPRKWAVAARPWALPASTMPVLFGTSLAAVFGGSGFNILRFVLALAAMILLHLGANMLSDVFDARRGLDVKVTPMSGAIIRGWLTERQVVRGSTVLIAAGSGLGIALAAMTGWELVAIGLAGIGIGLGYSWLKSRLLGDLSVFLNFGILGSLGAWFVQTRALSLLPVLWAVSMSMLVAAILHANNWRDAALDKEKGIITPAVVLGDRGSAVYYDLLIFSPFAVLLFFIAAPRIAAMPMPAMPISFFATAAALPLSFSLRRRARRRHAPGGRPDFITLDAATAQYNLLFGLLCTLAAWLSLIPGLP
ncbi:MAG: prenyltransferase [Acidobacteriota bacterium]|nr:prenyltransferase [Acidobacteriota bacterium]